MNDMTLGKDYNLIRIDEIIWVNMLFLYIIFISIFLF